MIHFIRNAGGVLRGTTVLLRLDFNTEDDWRMQAVLPTIKFLLKNDCKIVIASHKGRPDGFEKKLSLAQNAAHLTRLLGARAIAGGRVQFVRDFQFKKIKAAIHVAPSR